MKKLLSRILTIVAVVAITLVNFDSDLVMSFGGKEALASGNAITCWSQIKKDDNRATTFCPTCAAMFGWEADGGQSLCSPSNPGEN